MSLQDCLPAELRGEGTAITRLTAGLSGAAVHRVDAGGRAFVLKVAAATEPLDGWRRMRDIVERAAQAGLAPRVVHVDEERRAILSELVVDRSFPALLLHPATRSTAIALVGRTLRRVHELPPPAAGDGIEPLAFLAGLLAQLSSGAALPAFVGEAVTRLRGQAAPSSGRAPVLSHNDVNPSNLVYDGERLILLDWDRASANEPYYDLATISVFARLDDEACRALVAAYDDAPPAALPARFVYDRRLVAVVCGVVFLHLARLAGHVGDGAATLDGALGLGDFYQRLRAGAVSVADGEGRWTFGLALLKESVAR
jgi:aminoglycoside phosphotransferase (APT) family kinase protein